MNPSFMKFFFLILHPGVIATGLGVMLIFGNCLSLSHAASSPEFATLSTPTGHLISAEVADTLDKRAKGLMFRSSLSREQGMLFVFPKLGYWTFWMKNTLIPLDILWMNETGTILHLETHVPICLKTDDSCPRYSSHRESRYVLEINAGMAQELGLRPGQQLSISLPPSAPTR